MSILIRNLFKVVAADPHNTYTEVFTKLSAAQDWEENLWDSGSCYSSVIYRAVVENESGHIQWEKVRVG